VPKPFEAVEKGFMGSPNLLPKTRNQQLGVASAVPETVSKEFFNTLIAFRSTLREVFRGGLLKLSAGRGLRWSEKTGNS
jgi:hypothetical protein